MRSILLRHLKKILILLFGGTVLLIGIVLIFLPGPSFIVIPVGLAILAIEFSWAKKILKKVQNTAGNWIPRKWRIDNPEDNISAGEDKKNAGASPRSERGADPAKIDRRSSNN